MDEYYNAVAALPIWLAKPLLTMPPSLAERIHEVRIRRGCTVCFTVEGEQWTVKQIVGLPQEFAALAFTQEQLDEILYTLCRGSVHSYQEELSQGFLTLEGGHRVGLGGTYVRRSQEGDLLQTISSLNLRIARGKTANLPPPLCEALQGHFTGLVLAGEPDSGKTTLLRSIAAYLVRQRRAVALIDERSELLPEQLSSVSTDILCADRIAGLPKGKALQMALRTLAPQVILLDELGDMEEVHALEQGFFSGVDFVAGLHAANVEEALRRPQMQYMREHGMLRVLVTLQGRRAPAQIREVKFF